MTDTIPTNYGDLTVWTTADPQNLPAASAAMQTSVANALNNILGSYTTAALLLAASPVNPGYYTADDAPGGFFYWSGSGWTALAGVPVVSSTTVITAPSLGWQVRVADLEYRYDGSAWKVATYMERHQEDTTNSIRRVLYQSGIGKIAGAVSASLTENVTFPVAFTGVPVVVANFIGQRTAGAFNAAGLSNAPSLTAMAQVPSTTGFEAHIRQTTAGNLTAANDYYYSWTAIGVPA